MNKPISPVDIEYQILDICDAIEAETEQYAQLSELSANAEAKYKLTFAKALVDMAAHHPSKMTVQEKQARADLISNDDLRIFKIAEARRASSKEGLLSLRARLDALRTLSANLRHQT